MRNNSSMASAATSQCGQILAYLKKGKTLTPAEALKRFGCLRLAARVRDLRDQGYRIRTEMIRVMAANGRMARVARYAMMPAKSGRRADA